MIILSAEQITKGYLDKTLFDQITLGIYEEDKIGLIGVNGTGKSTLLQVLAGVKKADQGEVVKGKDVDIQFLSQQHVFNSDATILEQIFSGDSFLMALIRKHNVAVEALSKDPHNLVQQKLLFALQTEMDAKNAWRLESEAKNILTRLGIKNFDRSVRTLSGGEKKRVALAEVLIHPAKLLILDEPTNHLDSQMIEWLEDYLQQRSGALLMVTHDRYFLDRITNKIIELDSGKLYTYMGNYSYFVQKKAEREQMQRRMAEKRQSLFQHELAWMRRGARARSTKQKARIERFEHLKDNIVVSSEPSLDMRSIARRLGKKIITLEHVSKRFNDQTVIEDFSYTVLPTDRIGIVGRNGSGKSTLLNMIAGKLKPDTGQIEIGLTVKIGYFTQESQDMPEALRVIDFLKQFAEVLLTADGQRITVSQMLERFLFPPNMQYAPISKLSGGEKRRLSLLRVLLEAPNVLLLDEPTNDLDIQTLNLLEQYILSFSGPVLMVSHDRYFLNKLSDKIFNFRQDGKITQTIGNYAQYHEERMDAADEQVKAGPKAVQDTPKRSYRNNNSSAVLKFTYKEQKEYDTIELHIGEMESQLQSLEVQMNAAESDYVHLQTLTQSYEQLEQKYQALIERWVYLNELAEKIANQKSKAHS